MGGAAYDAVYNGQNSEGLSTQEKNAFVSIYENMMKKSFEHAKFMRSYPAIMTMLSEISAWHKAVVVKNKLKHSSVTYETTGDDGTLWIKLLSSAPARFVHDMSPAPVIITDESVAMDSPFRVMLSANPSYSGYLTGEGVSTALRMAWLYYFMQPDRMTKHTRFRVQALARFNDDIICEVHRYDW